MIPEDVKESLEKQKYRIIGKNGAVKLCPWLKEGMKGKKACYKERFYGIESHRCLQLTPNAVHCTQKCLFCWRAYEVWNENEMKDFDDPIKLLDEAIDAQRKLLSGFGGSLDIYEKELWEESKKPKHVAISLSGEPTLYPKLSEFISEIHKRDMTSFLVSNGTRPSKLRQLEELPTQLYLSLDAYEKELYEEICRPQIEDGWKKINESLELLSSLDTRTVLRITLLDGLNDEFNKKYYDLISKANPDFIEIKSYMNIGYSRKRLDRDKMVSNEKINQFARDLEKETDLSINDNIEKSLVTLLNKKDPKIDFNN